MSGGHVTMVRSRYALARRTAAGSLLAAVACSGPRVRSRDHLPAAGRSDSTHPLQYPEERPFRELAQQIPSLGGWYLDTASGNLVVLLKDLREADSARTLLTSRLARELSESRRTHPQAAVVFQKADYTWLELSEWRDRLRRVMPMTPGIVSLDVGEARNRVVIGVDSAADSIPARMLTRSLEIPDNGALIEVTGPFKPLPKVVRPPPRRQ